MTNGSEVGEIKKRKRGKRDTGNGCLGCGGVLFSSVRTYYTRKAETFAAGKMPVTTYPLDSAYHHDDMDSAKKERRNRKQADEELLDKLASQRDREDEEQDVAATAAAAAGGGGDEAEKNERRKQRTERKVERDRRRSVRALNVRQKEAAGKVFTPDRMRQFRSNPIFQAKREEYEIDELVTFDEFMDRFIPKLKFSSRIAQRKSINKNPDDTDQQQQHPYDKILRTLGSDMAKSIGTTVCSKNVNEGYINNVFTKIIEDYMARNRTEEEKAKYPTIREAPIYDVCISLTSQKLIETNEGRERSVAKFKDTLTSQKKNYEIKTKKVQTDFLRTRVTGLLISHYGECSEFRNRYSVSLICMRNEEVTNSKMKGHVIMGCFLYCLKLKFDEAAKLPRGLYPSSPIVILELADSYKNLAGFKSYSKLGFEEDTKHLRISECYRHTGLLPMKVNLDRFQSADEILEYAVEVKKIDKTTLRDPSGILTFPISQGPEVDYLAALSYHIDYLLSPELDAGMLNKWCGMDYTNNRLKGEGPKEKDVQCRQDIYNVLAQNKLTPQTWTNQRLADRLPKIIHALKEMRFQFLKAHGHPNPRNPTPAPPSPAASHIPPPHHIVPSSVYVPPAHFMSSGSRAVPAYSLHSPLLKPPPPHYNKSGKNRPIKNRGKKTLNKFTKYPPGHPHIAAVAAAATTAREAATVAKATAAATARAVATAAKATAVATAAKATAAAEAAAAAKAKAVAAEASAAAAKAAAAAEVDVDFAAVPAEPSPEAAAPKKKNKRKNSRSKSPGKKAAHKKARKKESSKPNTGEPKLSFIV